MTFFCFDGDKNKTGARQMLDSVVDPNSFSTRIRSNPDGSVTMLRTKGGMPQVTTTQGSQFGMPGQAIKIILDMDSGLVDLISTSQFGGGYDPGKFYETSYPQDYNQNFVAFDAEWRKELSANPGWTVSGNITYNGEAVVSKVRHDGSDSRAFLPASGVSEDEALLLRKTMAFMCPPSIFTGKCRQYVQALYGRPTLIHSMEGRPNISVPYYNNVDGKVVLDSSCGVFFDAQTGRHWLFKVSAEEIIVYKLLATKDAEAMRHFLKAGSVMPDGASKRHLETTILSYCLPEFATRQVIPLNMTIQPYSMGYGWHWNWDGTMADMVMNETFEQDATNTAMVSTHYRLSVTQTSPGVFSGSIAIIEGPTQWAVHYQAWCIAFPAWAEFALAKATPKHTLLFPCSAPFYAFYAENELKVCRVSVTYNPPSAPETKSPGWGSEAWTVGLRGGFQNNDNNSANYTAVFSVGETSLPASSLGKTKTFVHKEVSEKTIVIDKEPIGQSDVSFGADINDGYPLDADHDTPEWATVNYPAPGTIPFASPPPNGFYYEFSYRYATNRSKVNYSYEYSSGASATTTRVGVAIAFNDAEAVYLFGKEVTSTNYDSGFLNEYSSYEFVSGDIVSKKYNDDPTTEGIEGDLDFTQIGDHTYYKWYKAQDGTFIGGWNTSPGSTEETDWQQAFLVSRFGVHQATIPQITADEFADPNSEIINDAFNTRSGIHMADPLLLTKGKTDNLGMAGRAEPNMSLIIGWV